MPEDIKSNSIVSTNTNQTTRRNIDEQIMHAGLMSTMGEVCLAREQSLNAKAHLVAEMYFTAVFEQDIQIIDTLVKRIDGLVPTYNTVDDYANLFGDALEDVMEASTPQDIRIEPSDPPLIAVAKMTYLIATSHPKDPQGRKDRAKALTMILERTGGKITEPRKPEIEQRYVDPEWMQLGSGE